MSGPTDEPGLVPPGHRPPVSYVPLPWDSRGAPPPPGGFDVSAHPSNASGFVHPHQRRGRRTMHAVYVLLVIAILAGVGLRIVQQETRSTGGLPAGSGVTNLPDAIPPGVGLITRTGAGHFAVRLPHRAVVRSTRAVVGSATLALAFAVDAPAGVVVEGADVSPAVTSSHVDVALDSAIKGLESGVAASMTPSASRRVTFQGRPARQVSFTTRSGRTFTALAVIYGSTRFYLLFAPSGETFDAVASSFVALP